MRFLRWLSEPTGMPRWWVLLAGYAFLTMAVQSALRLLF